MGGTVQTAEQWEWYLKLLWIMVAPDPGISAEQVAAALPSIEEIVVYSNAGLPHSYMNAVGEWYLNLFVLAAQACEKLGLHEQGLIYAEEAATNTDVTKAGTCVPGTQCQGFRFKGRCLAAMGKTQAAEEALESALKAVAGLGYFLLEVLALRDLKVCVLDKDGRAEEGTTRLKASVLQLLGATPTAENVEALALALGPEVDLRSVLAFE